MTRSQDLDRREFLRRGAAETALVPLPAPAVTRSGAAGAVTACR